MGVEFVPIENEEKQFGVIGDSDVVVLPAFGASVQEMQLLNDKGVQIVDTTCPWVSKVGAREGGRRGAKTLGF